MSGCPPVPTPPTPSTPPTPPTPLIPPLHWSHGQECILHGWYYITLAVCCYCCCPLIISFDPICLSRIDFGISFYISSCPPRPPRPPRPPPALPSIQWFNHQSNCDFHLQRNADPTKRKQRDPGCISEGNGRFSTAVTCPPPPSTSFHLPPPPTGQPSAPPTETRARHSFCSGLSEEKKRTNKNSSNNGNNSNNSNKKDQLDWVSNWIFP